MRIGVVTLFPEMIHQALGHGITGRAIQSGLVQVECANPRDFAQDVHRTVDDTPIGGGPGMVLKAGVTLQAARSLGLSPDAPVLVMDPAGTPFSQAMAEELSLLPEWMVICGRYEGFDERIIPLLNARPVSVGDFVLTGGELPALMVMDASSRLLPGALGDPQSHEDDSHSGDGLLGFPLYTKPANFEGEEAPSVLVGGHHGRISDWRRLQQLLRTRERRPDLFARARLTKKDLDLLRKASEVPQGGS